MRRWERSLQCHSNVIKPAQKWTRAAVVGRNVGRGADVQCAQRRIALAPEAWATLKNSSSQFFKNLML